MIETSKGFFVQLAGEAVPRGPFRSRDHAERAEANVAAKAERRAQPRPRREKAAKIEPRVVVAAAEGSLPRHERRERIAKKRSELQLAKRRAKAQARKAQLATGGR